MGHTPVGLSLLKHNNKTKKNKQRKIGFYIIHPGILVSGRKDSLAKPSQRWPMKFEWLRSRTVFKRLLHRVYTGLHEFTQRCWILSNASMQNVLNSQPIKNKGRLNASIRKDLLSLGLWFDARSMYSRMNRRVFSLRFWSLFCISGWLSHQNKGLHVYTFQELIKVVNIASES